MNWNAESEMSRLHLQKIIHFKKEGKNMKNKRLYKSSVNRMLCGVCGGIAEYFNIDPTLVRLAWVIVSGFGGAGIWAYLIAAVIMPNN